ncbi:MAG TPA: hypothetical protein VER17_04925 [Tepidisphaeraceae bacterium]|nr:hypothetical protein [Tepidisphaeraceae bacterium]
MSTLDIRLRGELRAYLEEQVARGGYKDASEFIEFLVEANKLRGLRAEVEAMLLEAADGPFAEWTDDDVADIERLGTRLIERRKRQ